MCVGCYIDYLAPTAVTQALIAMAERIEAANAYGALHIVIDDWNLEDEAVSYCRDLDYASSEERALAADFLALPIEDRVVALALADGYLNADGSLPGFVQELMAASVR